MATSIVIVKSMVYRGVAGEEWSNRYYLDGADPTSAADWLALWNAITAQEKTLYLTDCQIVRGYGYDNDSPTAAAVWVKDLVETGPLIPGTLTLSSWAKMAGDQAACVWWKTSRLTSKGKAIYLRKFFHAGRMPAAGGDQLEPGYKSTLEAFATLLASGAGVTGRHIRGPGQASDVIFASGAHSNVTTRTLKRRGRRPTPAP